MDDLVTFSPKKLRDLKKAYHKAKGHGQTEFVFEGRDYDLKYAMYLIGYLENEFTRKKTENEAAN